MQPYIFKKQILSLIVVLVLFFCAFFFKQSEISLVLALYFFVVLSITFTPSLRKKIKYPIIMHNIIYYSPMLISILFIKKSILVTNNRLGIGLAIILGCLLSLSKYKEDKKNFSSVNILIQGKINKVTLVMESLNDFLALISEELFYRSVIINLLFPVFGWYVLIVDVILFVHSHFINRWADQMFNLKSYIYHGILAITLSLIYLISASIVGIVICHLIFNYSEYYQLLKRYKIENKPLFFDY